MLSINSLHRHHCTVYLLFRSYKHVANNDPDVDLGRLFLNTKEPWYTSVRLKIGGEVAHSNKGQDGNFLLQVGKEIFLPFFYLLLI